MKILTRTFLVALACFIGGVLWMITMEEYRPKVEHFTWFLWTVYSLEAVIGIGWLAVLLSSSSRNAKVYSYIGSQAREWGFMGTLGGMMVMFIALGISVKSGQTGAIKQTIAGLSTAVITSIIGIAVAKVCKHMHFICTLTEEESDHE